MPEMARKSMAETLKRCLNFPLTTSPGDIELLGALIGAGSFDDLAGDSDRIEIFGMEYLCLGLDSLAGPRISIRSASWRRSGRSGIRPDRRLLRRRGPGGEPGRIQRGQGAILRTGLQPFGAQQFRVNQS